MKRIYADFFFRFFSPILYNVSYSALFLMKSDGIALIAVEILVGRGSARKIGADSRNKLLTPII